MEKSRFAETQIVGILKIQESGTPTEEKCQTISPDILSTAMLSFETSGLFPRRR